MEEKIKFIFKEMLFEGGNKDENKINAFEELPKLINEERKILHTQFELHENMNSDAFQEIEDRVQIDVRASKV
jgi:hypothetical protein